MASSRFSNRLTAHVALLLATLVVVAALVTRPDLRAVAVLVGALAVGQAYQLVRFVHRTNRELVRLLDAIRYDDFQQGFSVGELGSTFAELEATFVDVLGRFRAARLDREAQRRYLEAVVEHVPVAILAVRDDGSVELLNNAARRLLDATTRTALGALGAYGAAFQRDLAQAATASRIVTRMTADGVERALILSATRIVVTGEPIRIVTLQDIQRELEWSELAAWQDMARILTHEIMNSLTPIASLARTADDLVDDLAKRTPGGDELTDIRDAIQTVARRSEALMRFVRSYRQYTQMPPPTLRPLVLDDYLRRFAHLLVAEWASRGIALVVAPPSTGVTIEADDSLLDQAIINLLKNAADAAARSAEPRVWLDARLSERGRPVIEIADNGPGLDDALGDQIFLPFFTTKPEGSGIGLALARQVMLVHRGAISAAPRPGGGAVFRLTF